GGAEQPRPHRPGGARAETLRAARPRRGGPGAREHAGGRGEAVLSRPEAAQGRVGDDARRLGGSLTMSTSSGSRDYVRFDELAEEFAERYRRGERPSL